MSKLTDVQIRDEASRLKGWSIIKGRLEKTFVFPDFARAVVFVNKIVNPIEENQQYPIIGITYNRVSVSLYSNEASGLTAVDFAMAKDIDALA